MYRLNHKTRYKVNFTILTSKFPCGWVNRMSICLLIEMVYLTGVEVKVHLEVKDSRSSSYGVINILGT